MGHTSVMLTIKHTKRLSQNFDSVHGAFSWIGQKQRFKKPMNFPSFFQFNARFTFSVTVCEFNTRERTKSCFGITVEVKSTSGLCYVDIAASRDS